MLQLGLLHGLGELDTVLSRLLFGQFLLRRPSFPFRSQQLVGVGRRGGPADVGEQLEGPADVRGARYHEEAFLVPRIQRRCRIDQDARLRRERKKGIAGHIQLVLGLPGSPTRRGRRRIMSPRRPYFSASQSK